VELELQGYSSLPSDRLQYLCKKAIDKIETALNDKIERNRKELKEQWENRNVLERVSCYIFREKAPDLSDNWIFHNTTDPDTRCRGRWGTLCLWAYKRDELQALRQMLALCKTTQDNKKEIWFSAEFASLLQRELPNC